jgi:biotin synthase
MKRSGSYEDKSFIRVEWPNYKVYDIIDSIREHNDMIQRICISMVTNKRGIEDTKKITRRLRENLDVPVSLLISPTILNKDDLVQFKNSGADKIGIAVDCATPELFDKIRGKGVNGPHKWRRYWECYREAIDVFGKGNVGVHLIVGLGETEKEMIEIIQYAFDLGGGTHLFSFFPECDSQLSNHPQPPIQQYRRVQLARYIIDNGISNVENFKFDSSGKLIDYGIPEVKLKSIIEKGDPFMTSGCIGRDGKVACTRPFANCLPGPELRNYPFQLEREDIIRVNRELWD